ncbi:MAG: glycoside hydrolase family 15 protein [Proteobacteria bacterium]|nr:glycoside hydrolase family 15 protein [Pseudomonadota bacterium]
MPIDPAGFAPAIEDYALIGDCRSAALVSRTGSIDWLCWPRFDSPACFAALLGRAEHGRWRIAPAAEASASRRYLPGTLILETVFETAQGSVALIDFMDYDGDGARLPASVVRIVEGRSGAVDMRLDLALRFDYGAAIPWVTRLPEGGGMQAVAGPDMTVLRCAVPLRGQGFTTVADFTVAAGERAAFVLTHGASQLPPPPPVDAGEALERTRAFWTEWSGRCAYQGPWRNAVLQSLRTLKALTYAPTGGVVAAPTTSLPEQLGGERNWDYRFCWLRDATFTLLAMLKAGYRDEARAWGAWLRRAVAGSPAQIQTMYGLAGERRLVEWTVGNLPGYQGAAPVRVGNAAAEQLQLDVYGELMDAIYQAAHAGLVSAQDAWGLQRQLILHLERIWRGPDEGIWEVRGGRRHFTFSKVMAWVAVDRAIRTAEEFGLHGPLSAWRRLRDEIHASVCANGFDAEKNSFVQSYGDTALDASCLLIPLVGFLPPEDPRVAGTVEAIGRELMQDGLIQRYRTQEGVDGLPPGEGIFLACSFWYADALVLLGRHREARELFERLLSLCNDVGLLAEEYDPAARRQVGNFPQAFSHLALIDTAMNLTRHGPAHERAG